MTIKHRYVLPFFLLLTSIGTLAVAYISQYGFGLKPCVLCLYQRVPYFVVIGIALLSFICAHNVKISRALYISAALVLLIGAGIAFYHVGVEHKWFEGLTSCAGVAEKKAQTIEELRAQLYATQAVRCDQPQFVFLTLSMAGWNMLWSLGLVLITLLVAWKRKQVDE